MHDDNQIPASGANLCFERRRYTMELALAVMLAVTLVAPLQAASLNLTLNETTFGSTAALATVDDGAVWSGTLEVPTYAASANANFFLGAYSINLADRSGGGLLFHSGLPNNVTGDPGVTNDAAGLPYYLSNAIPQLPGFANSFSLNIAVFFDGTPQTGHILTFNTINGRGTGPHGNEGTWILSAFESDGGAIVGPPEIYRYGTYHLSAVPIPAALCLFGSAVGCLGWRARRSGRLTRPRTPCIASCSRSVERLLAKY